MLSNSRFQVCVLSLSALAIQHARAYSRLAGQYGMNLCLKRSFQEGRRKEESNVKQT